MSEFADIFKCKSKELTPIPTNTQPKHPQFEGIKAIIFDIYGTLFISGAGDIGISSAQQKEELLLEILENLFQFRLNNATSLTEELVNLIETEHLTLKKKGVEYPEVDIIEIWTRLMSSYGTFTQDQIATLAVTYEASINPVWPMPNLASTLSALNDSPILTGVVSNAQFYTPHIFPAFLDLSIHEAGFVSDLCIYSYKEKQAKPGTHLYTKLVAQLAHYDIKPEETLYIGNDIRNDIWPAHRAGLKTVLFAGDARSLRLREEMNLPSPDAIITDLSKIISLV